MSKQGNELNVLMQKYGTDKGTPGNSYQEFYASLFADKRENIKDILEIGILGGASLKVWREYFPNAEIIGIDKVPEYLIDYGERITAMYCDQSSQQSLGHFKSRCPPMDIIIDDGSHVYAHQIITFNTLFPCVKPGGWYVIEDTFLTDEWEGEAGKIFYAMQEITATCNRYKSDVRSVVAEQIYSITYFDSMIAIQKKREG